MLFLCLLCSSYQKISEHPYCFVIIVYMKKIIIMVNLEFFVWLSFYCCIMKALSIMIFFKWEKKFEEEDYQEEQVVGYIFFF